MTISDSWSGISPDDGAAMSFLDGNALAGPLTTVFAVDVTVTVLTCAGCLRRSRLATLRVYDAGLGLVARCPGCDHVVLRYASTPAGDWLDLGGTVALQVPTGIDPPTGVDPSTGAERPSGADPSTGAEPSTGPSASEARNAAAAPDVPGATD